MSIPFEQLPADTQEKIKDTLRAYEDVSVYFENGEYRFGIMLKENYAPDHRYVGTYYAKELFTEQERMLNYVNEFQCYPIEYKGKRNYADFHTGKRETFTMDDDGNIIIAATTMEKGNKMIEFDINKDMSLCNTDDSELYEAICAAGVCTPEQLETIDRLNTLYQETDIGNGREPATTEELLEYAEKKQTLLHNLGIHCVVCCVFGKDISERNNIWTFFQDYVTTVEYKGHTITGEFVCNVTEDGLALEGDYEFIYDDNRHSCTNDLNAVVKDIDNLVKKEREAHVKG